jgi:hypothetical protein
MTLEDAIARVLTWRETEDVDYPWETTVDGQVWRIRLGDFPAEAAYGLVVGNDEIGTFDRWPKETWSRPAPKPEDGK